MIKLFFLCFLISCQAPTEKTINTPIITPGAHRASLYLELCEDKKVALVGNQTSVVDDIHLLDFLLEKNVNVTKVMTPEHGFRGKVDAGEKVDSEQDEKTGVEIISLYGKHRKPTKEDLTGVDLLIFDLQDVGVRFYTYISTLHLVMEACAENGVPIMVLDRPNPNAHYVDGPVLEPEYTSFIGMHEVPVVYGMTIGEYAQMINGEGWLDNGLKAELKVIPCDHYNHNMVYELPIKPSPNLPNLRSILLYPSLCFFEGTHVSVGRGTNTQFQVLGAPVLSGRKSFQFTPQSMEGAKYPKLENKTCYGDDFTEKYVENLFRDNRQLDLELLISYYQMFVESGDVFFLENKFFNKLAGNDQLMTQIQSGVPANEIRRSWEDDLLTFKQTRAKYLLYP